MAEQGTQVAWSFTNPAGSNVVIKYKAFMKADEATVYTSLNGSFLNKTALVD